MKGIVLAGGAGTRLSPRTKIVSKQLLPVYDKPLIYYSLSVLMLANIRKILIICSPSQIESFKKLLSNGAEIGIELSYAVQEAPRGIAESFIIAENFLQGSRSALILGDNIFHGPGLGRKLETFNEIEGAQIFGYRVQNPQPYGVATVDAAGDVVNLEEKPLNSISNIAIPGLYFFDGEAPKYAKYIMPSARGELEILDLLKFYQNSGRLKLEILPRGTAWFDSGTFRDLHDASSYVRLMEERTGEHVGDPFEVAQNQGWIK